MLLQDAPRRRALAESPAWGSLGVTFSNVLQQLGVLGFVRDRTALADSRCILESPTPQHVELEAESTEESLCFWHPVFNNLGPLSMLTCQAAESLKVVVFFGLFLFDS